MKLYKNTDKVTKYLLIDDENEGVWLEPYELPTEEEIEKILLFHYGKGKNKLSWRVKAAKTVAKAITNLLER
jgi:hypothetical protein